MEKSVEEITSAALRDFLLEGEGDYIGLYEIFSVARRLTGIDDSKTLSLEDSNTFLQATLAFVCVMLTNGFEIVDLTKDGKCTPWPDQSPENVIREISTAWINPNSWIGFNFWFNKINKQRPSKD